MAGRAFPAAIALAMALAGCAEIGPDKGRDTFVDRKDLSDLVAGIWVSPNGCDYWIIDDGAEGYLSQRLDRYGKPVCSGVAEPAAVTGPFKEGSTIPDPL